MFEDMTEDSKTTDQDFDLIYNRRPRVGNATLEETHLFV